MGLSGDVWKAVYSRYRVMDILDGKYEGTIGSELERDGMYLEVTEPNNYVNCFLEIFYSDLTDTFSITLFKENIELDLVEQAIKIARIRLVPGK